MASETISPLMDLKIAAILKFSTLDYPGKLSAVVFCQGCPIRCVYCHNPDFQDVEKAGSIPVDELLKFLDSRKDLLDAVVFSGGEPLMQKNICEAIKAVKDKGFSVGIHTAGTIPAKFSQVLPIVDWVGFDIKTLFSKYETITQISNTGDLAKQSFNMLLESGVDYEIRTTVDSRHISSEDLLEIARFLAESGVKKWVLQECILRYVDKDLNIPLPDEKIIASISKYIDIEARKQ